LKHPDVKKSVDIRVKMQKYLKSYILLCGYFSTMIYKNASIAQKKLEINAKKLSLLLISLGDKIEECRQNNLAASF